MTLRPSRSDINLRVGTYSPLPLPVVMAAHNRISRVPTLWDRNVAMNIVAR